MKDLPIIQSQNAERNLQERSPVKTKLVLRLPQQVCLKQGCKIDLEWSFEIPGAHTHHLPCSSVFVDVEVMYVATAFIVTLSFPSCSCIV